MTEKPAEKTAARRKEIGVPSMRPLFVLLGGGFLAIICGYVWPGPVFSGGWSLAMLTGHTLLAGGAVCAVLLITRYRQALLIDIAKLRNAHDAVREGQERYRSAFEHAIEPRMIVKDWLILDANDAMLEFAGAKSRPEFIGTDIRTLVHARSAERFVRCVNDAATQGHVISGIGMVTEGGAERVVEISAAPVSIAGRSAMLVDFRDITDRMRAEAERDRLMDEMARRNVALESATRDAQQMSKLKSEFLANISHELRTPLNSIIGFSALMIEDERRDVPKEFMQFADRIHKNGRRLLGLIEDLLDISRIEAGRVKVLAKPFRLEPFIRELMEIHKPEADRNRLALSYEIAPNTPDSLNTDKLKLSQILANYIDNALKFTDEDGAIVLAVSGAGNKVVFTVRDTGIGIPDDDQKIIFEKFKQLDSPMTKRFRGAGLGLAICAANAELLKGRVWLESVVGKGSAFHVELPSDFGYDLPGAPDDRRADNRA